MLRLNLTLSASSDSISSVPGNITFNLTVTNDSNTAAKNIRIRHAARDIYTINELAPGQSMVISRDFSLSMAGKYQFTAVATDVQDNPVEFTSNALNIAYIAPTAAPTKAVVVTIAPAVTYTPVPESYTPTGGQTRGILFTLTLAFGALFGLAAILLGASAVMRAKARAKSNAAFDTFELAGARDYTAEPDTARQPVETLAQEAGEAAKAPVEDSELPHEKYLRAQDAPAAGEAAAAPLPTDEEGAFRLTREAQGAEEVATEKADAAAEEAGEEGQRRSRRAERYKDSEATTDEPKDGEG